ncbi:MAG: alpha/beta hydrolase [Rhodoferax sp.]|uniref:alpha/beta fold hydrolase n=1 Tax=Rhodoferax sp. TaxID=50421 RepID=UPI001B7400EF|nr:alpha/beta hydrolase [Rhodoferax sp.]MBP9907446.1 alpha/beta hydrolase [Rhodoferax sp.]
MQHHIISADDGERLHLYQTGQGTPLLLLHGWTASHAAWSPLITPLTRLHPTVRLLRPDARGHGGHALQTGTAVDVRRLARDVMNLLDHLELERVAAVGHSMGALTLWQCLRDFGSTRFSALAFIDQSPKLMTDPTWHDGIYGDFGAARSQQFVDDLQTDFVEAVLRLSAFGLNPRARETYLRNSSGWRVAREALGKLEPATLISLWQSLVAADYRDVLPQIALPTLLAYGACSNFYTLDTAHHVAAQIRSARLSLYDGADHSPHLAQPERFAAELVDLMGGPALAV